MAAASRPRRSKPTQACTRPPSCSSSAASDHRHLLYRWRMFRGLGRWAIGLIIIWIAIFNAQGELFTWENDGPDNSWLCSDASLSLSYVGDPSTLYSEIKGTWRPAVG